MSKKQSNPEPNFPKPPVPSPPPQPPSYLRTDIERMIQSLLDIVIPGPYTLEYRGKVYVISGDLEIKHG